MKAITGNETSGRVANGQFAPGNPGGPGRPSRQTQREYLRAMIAGCSLGDWREIVGKAVAHAKQGDAKAREWLARYLVGSPVLATPTPSTLAVEDEAGLDPLAHMIQDAAKIGFVPNWMK